MKSLLAIGACYLDVILTVDRYPSEDEKVRASSIVRRRGGNVPNALEVLQQLLDLHQDPIPSVVLLAVLPSRTSIGTQQIWSSFGPKVDMTQCMYREECNEPASSYIVRSHATKSRTLVNHNELSEMTLDEFVPIANKLGSEIGWYHFEGRIPEVTLNCMRYLRQRFPSVQISVEVEKPARPGLQDLAAEANVVFYSKSWAQGKEYSTAEDCLRAQALLTPKASILCCTWGHEGASALELPTSTFKHCPAWVDERMEVVDTIGAGDTFIAAMLYCLIYRGNDWTLSSRLEFANKLAGRKVTQEGFSGLGSAILSDAP